MIIWKAEGKNIAKIVIVIVIVIVANVIVPASCNYWRWGSGGRQENINAICILALNHINDKVSQDFIIIESVSTGLNYLRFFSFFGGGSSL